MTFSTEIRNPNRVYLRCPTNKKYGKLSSCTPKSIREDFLQDQVIQKIKEVADNYLNKDDLIKNADTDKNADFTNSLKIEITEITKQLEEIKNIIMSLYKDKVKQVISERDFIEMLKEFNNQRDILTERINKIEGELKNAENNKNSVISIDKILSDFLEFDDIDRVTLVSLISKIEIFHDKNIVLKFNFAEP